MDLLTGYASSDSESGQQHPTTTNNKQPIKLLRPFGGTLNSAPLPSVPTAVLRSKGLLCVANADVNNNTSNGAIQGPALLSDPLDKTSSFIAAINPKTGSTSKMEADAAVDEFSFAANRNAFQRGSGEVGGEVALAPGDVERAIYRNDFGHQRRFPPNYGHVDGGDNGDGSGKQQEATALTVGQKRPNDNNPDDDNAPKSRRARRSAAKASEGPLLHNPDDELTYGIWGPPSTTELTLQQDSIPAIQSGTELHPRIKAERAYLKERDRQRGLLAQGMDDKDKFDRMVERKMAHLLPPRLEGDNPQPVEPSTVFHGEQEVDYRGRSWIMPPSGVKPVEPFDVDDHACFMPKKCVARFTCAAANKKNDNKATAVGVHCIRLFPRTGHLLLAAGLDGKCTVWSIAIDTKDKGAGKLMRTYTGHSAAVRDVQFNHDGTKFISASFDRYLRLWDTESGQVLNTFTNRRVPYVVKFYPHDDNIFVVGCSDNKIVAYDATTAEITQEYDHHLAPVNTITFVEDNGTKMVTSSDDKKVLVWEWDIGVPIKYISDPTMHSMPVVTMHPSQQYLLGQSLDNRIVVYQAGERYSLQRKKKFQGHNVAGYACDITVSPDGRFVCSGDADGKLCFWDFKKTKMLQKYHAHDKGPCIGAVWHPIEPSVVFSCGWDGVIKMWK